MHGREGHKFDDNQSGNGKEHGTTLAEAVIEDLGHGLLHRGAQDLLRITHAVTQNDVEQETGNVGEGHGQGDSPRGLELGIAHLLRDVRGRVVVSHCPADGKETEQPAKANGLPATRGINLREDVARIMLIFGQDQQGNGTGHENTNVENDIKFGHLLHPVGRQRVHNTRDDRKSSHDANGGVSGDGVVEVAAHGDGGQKHLRSTVLRRGHTGNLTKKVKPAREPEGVLARHRVTLW